MRSIALLPSLGLPLLVSSVAGASSLMPRSRHHRHHRSLTGRTTPPALGWNLPLSSIRGGGGVAIYSDDEEYDSEEDELSENELSNSDVDEEDEEESAPSTSSTSASGPPVKLSVKTALQSPLIDQHLEFTASRKRTVGSLRQAVSKTMRGRPALSSVVLKYQGRMLDDDEETLDDILMDVDSDDEEEDEEKESDDESDIGEEDEDTIKVSLTCDIVPPVDAKFGIEFREKINKMSTRQIMEAYCINMAGMVYGQELQAREGDFDDFEVDGEEEDGEEASSQSHLPGMAENVNHSLNIRKKAAIIQKQFEGTLSEETRQLMQEEHERVKNAASGSDEISQEATIYGLTANPQNSNASSSNKARGRNPNLKGGATMNVKRALQRNLNVNWADTTRNSLLFLFFGYFGGRNSFSRTFLLLSSPLCFFVQTRPVKVAMKQLFYTMGEPPGIALSLLPAPQQRIMSLDYGAVMRGLYGEKVLLKSLLNKSEGEGKEEWLEMEMEQLEGGRSDSASGDASYDEDEYDQYDHEDDEYDLDDDDEY